MKIVISRPCQEQLDDMNVRQWQIWECRPSAFDWYYDETETCYIVSGDVTVEADGETVRFGAGDLVVFPKGLGCRWIVHKPVRKFYRFG